jgi:sugar O-acyltransferase (sialic acid O-acetyltransferase NeuD family)
VVRPVSEMSELVQGRPAPPTEHRDPSCVIVVGAGGHGAEVAAYMSDLVNNGWPGTFLGFLDDLDLPEKAGRAPILGRIDDFVLRSAVPSGDAGYIVAVGQNRARKHVVERIEKRFGRELQSWTLVHPRAYVGSNVAIGGGTMLAPMAIATTRVTIGRHVILNVKASVSHDVVVGDYAMINPAATVCGNVTIGEGAFIGAGAVIREGISVGAWAVVGAGAVVVRDIPAHSLAVGVPARVVKSLEA